MRLSRINSLCVVVLWLMVASTGWCVVLFDSDYLIQTYAVYDSGGMGTITDIDFGPDNMLYVSHQGADFSYARDGAILKVTPSGNVSVFADKFVHTKNIAWGGGTAYGDYLYVCDQFDGNGKVIRLDLAGNKTAFTGAGLDQPMPVEIDRTGNYGGYMYVGSSAHDHITRIMPDGSSELFYTFHTSTLSPFEIAFDTTGRFGGLMYVAVGDPDRNGGVMALDPQGNADMFASAIVSADDLAFDTSGTFGGDLFVFGRAGQGLRMLRVAPDGAVGEFGYLVGGGKIAFGPDGAMYTWEQIGNTAVISKIFVPEPASLVLLAVGGLMLRRRR